MWDRIDKIHKSHFGLSFCVFFNLFSGCYAENSSEFKDDGFK